jgi:hypothetical protein
MSFGFADSVDDFPTPSRLAVIFRGPNRIAADGHESASGNFRKILSHLRAAAVSQRYRLL